MDYNDIVLAMEHVHVRRGCFVLQDLCLSVMKNEIFAILGKTGAGKSMLLETAAGFYPLEQGTVLLEGQDLQRLPIHSRNIGYLYQDYGLFPHMTAERNIDFGLRMRRITPGEIRKRVVQMADMFEIGPLLKQYPGTLSGGEQQRVALARAMITHPSLLLLDEPFSALDPVTKQRMHQILLQIREEFNCAVLFVTHNFSEAERLADRIGILIRGRMSGVVRQSELYTADWEPEAKEFLGLTEREKIDDKGSAV